VGILSGLDDNQLLMQVLMLVRIRGEFVKGGRGEDHHNPTAGSLTFLTVNPCRVIVMDESDD